MGQGSDTAMAQIVGEVLNIPAESIRVVPRDTDVTPYDMGTLGSRSLFHMGNAVRLAAEEARDKIAALAREVGRAGGQQHADRRAVQEEIRDAGRQHHRHRQLQAGLRAARSRERADAERDAVLDGGRPPAPRSRSIPRPGTCAVHQARQRRRRAARPINPRIVETQISGAALMQLGFTMFEKMDSTPAR